MRWPPMASGSNGTAMAIAVELASWALLSLSLFNGLVLLWLGLTTFLAAEERRGGLWLILTGMVMAGVFFLSHTAILADQLALAEGIAVERWWTIGWTAILCAPLLWYLLMLWYAGFWQEKSAALRRHRPALALLSLYAVLLLALHLFDRPLPSFARTLVLDFSDTRLIAGIPALLVLFPPYALLCVVLPLHAIRHTAPARYEFRDLARQRAYPWLMRATLTLCVVSVVVAAFVAYVVAAAQRGDHQGYLLFDLPLLFFDLAVTAMIAVAIVALGQAVTAYEIFTGKTLPRRGFARQWYTALAIAFLVSALIGHSLLFHTHPMYAFILLAAGVMAGSALLTWRTFVYRDQTIANLRPFVSGRSLLQNMMDPEQDPLTRAQALFESMCERFLGAVQAQITPARSLSLLVGTPLVYPAAAQPAQFPIPGGDQIQQLDPRQHAGFHWLIPLWSERGRSGVLLLGEKVGKGLYTEEEIQVAQAAGERILDLLAGEIMAQQMVRLQRRRMAEQRVMDFQTRRALHDRSLPALHEAILALSTATDPATAEVIRTLSLIHKEIANLIHTTPALPAYEQGAGFLAMVRNAIQQEFAGEFEQIDWQLCHGGQAVDGLTADILYGAVREAVRNAAIHGRGDDPKRALSLWITVRDTPGLTITVRDNGVGPHAGHTQLGGSGSGLALHGALMALIGGSLSIEEAPTGGTVVSLAV